MQYRDLLPFALAALALTAASARAQSTVTVYGRLNVSLERADAGHSPRDRAVSRESNNRSVIGFRGTEELGAGLQALFQIEGSLAVDTGVGPSLANRDTRVGLQTPWGLVFAGHWGTPYLLSTSGFDPWYPTTAGYMALMANGSAPTTSHTANTASFDRRQQNVVQYWTPTVHGLTGRVAYAFNDGDIGPNGSRPDLASASLSWDDGPWNVALAHERHRDYQGPGLTDAATKLGVAYRVGAWRLAAAAERLRYETPTGALRRDAFFVAATWQALPAVNLRASFTHAGDGKGPTGARVGFIIAGDDTGARQWTLGADYTLSKRTGLYAYVSRIDNQARAAYDFAINPIGVGAGEKPTVFAVGSRHAF
ncbi:porin [Mitsuaria sp. GD03876]|uniref:porin n=1 Tax=Mitsuaria sp. GD03876 TaxID=2975399 RepID=UPI00244AFD04|nr:porin [Mitsuaria sp. GD03876]MDH0863495.1 porin [Mitsuaria sp. GD03876]